MLARKLVKIDMEKYGDPRVMYLIIGPDKWLSERIAKMIEMPVDERFNAAVTKHLNAYIMEGQQPPEPIQSAILNMADDVMAGREAVLRAGDYIALRSFIR